ncbi:hypothetical protein CAOG_00044 [Capsaspora owczarzaki ATCC 30864]|uniref:Saposin B-type domain-containing protein n=1 Tax=Capsaspora owczarzaki (strain ATCC 30864) TaxID=595528 RepID=A0A0D2VF88_CAPO3|nr:hypothetical protein CAOG_00044 [Capsaspora owczarzaki ATCC 30864]KJE88382.1 hypothetical protein CAOG_000044 [Capsaspora owczarzaki ATCC 30864]|eukprot:XP_004364915.2 hypothetical protein CAOG_00044 [Capsaspora owczarzaki ATCC 30864]
MTKSTVRMTWMLVAGLVLLATLPYHAASSEPAHEGEAGATRRRDDAAAEQLGRNPTQQPPLDRAAQQPDASIQDDRASEQATAGDYTPDAEISRSSGSARDRHPNPIPNQDDQARVHPAPPARPDPSRKKLKEKAKKSGANAADALNFGKSGGMPKMNPAQLEELIEVANMFPEDFGPSMKELNAPNADKEGELQHFANQEFSCSHCQKLAKMVEASFRRRTKESSISTLLTESCVAEELDNQQRLLCSRLVEKVGDELISAVAVGEPAAEVCDELDVCISKARLQAQAKIQVEERKRAAGLKSKYQSFVQPSGRTGSSDAKGDLLSSLKANLKNPSRSNKRPRAFAGNDEL